MFKLLRFYTVASFISIFIAAALLTLFYRQVTIQWITHLAEESNAALAKTALNSIKPELLKYLHAAENTGKLAASAQNFPSELAADIENLMRDASIIRFKIYHHNGMVVFSSSGTRIGEDQSKNAGFMSAIRGRIASNLIYRDSFNPFDKTTEEDNLLHSYIPVRSSLDEPVQGVFEIFTDVNPMVRENERVLLIILLGGEVIMAALFATLVLVVRRANHHLETEQQRIRERAATLEILSNRLLNSDEEEKKKIAFDLHEGLAQTLSAIKANVESSRQIIGANHENATALESIVPMIQSAIQEVRSIATDLRPPSLDGLGLIPTINWFCREFECVHPGTQVELVLSGTEGGIPSALKIVIYRIIESAFGNIAQHTHADWIQLALQIENLAITLKMSCVVEEASARQEQRPDLQLRFAEVRERTMLSGGMFSATQDLIGKITLTSSWPGQGQAGR